MSNIYELFIHISTLKVILLPATPQMSLVREHCLYHGAYSGSGDLRQT